MLLRIAGEGVRRASAACARRATGSARGRVRRRAGSPFFSRSRAIARVLHAPRRSVLRARARWRGPRLPPDVVRPGLSSRDRRARQRLRLLELASRASSSASAAAASTRTPEPGGGTARASSRSRSASSKRPRGSKDRVQDATSPSPPGPRSGPPRSPHRGGGGIFRHLAACARVRATEIGRRSVRPRGA